MKEKKGGRRGFRRGKREREKGRGPISPLSPAACLGGAGGGRQAAERGSTIRQNLVCGCDHWHRRKEIAGKPLIEGGGKGNNCREGEGVFEDNRDREKRGKRGKKLSGINLYVYQGA